MKKVNNASQFPKRYYGLHFAEGTALYQHEGVEPHMVFVGEKAMRKMDATFEGKPVYVGHVDKVELDKLPDADGYVVKSFYNEADGKHWCEFIVVSDKGHEAIRNGFKLSNAYEIKQSAGGGRWHGMDYHQEIIEGEYEHLAIVDDPRYAESIILTPEEFKEYNSEKKKDLEVLKNSNNNQKKKIKGKSMFNFFKKEKVENSSDLESMSVVLPRSKKEVSIEKLINEADEEAMNEDKPEYAVGHALVKTNEGEMTVEELLNKYNELCDKKENEDEEKKKEVVIIEDEDDKENEEDLEEELDNEEDEEEKKHNKKKNFNALKNAEKRNLENSIGIDLSYDQVARGKQKYGSK